jgi:hypothetical protein
MQSATAPKAAADAPLSDEKRELIAQRLGQMVARHQEGFVGDDLFGLLARTFQVEPKQVKAVWDGMSAVTSAS